MLRVLKKRRVATEEMTQPSLFFITLERAFAEGVQTEAGKASLKEAIAYFSPERDDINQMLTNFPSSVYYAALDLFVYGKNVHLLNTIINNWDYLQTLPDQNITIESPDNRHCGSSVLFLTCFAFEKKHKRPLLLTLRDWNDLPSLPDLNRAPCHVDSDSNGISPAWLLLKFVEDSAPVVSERISHFFHKNWSRFKPAINLNLAPQKPSHPSVGVTVFEKLEGIISKPTSFPLYEPLKAIVHDVFEGRNCYSASKLWFIPLLENAKLLFSIDSLAASAEIFEIFCSLIKTQFERHKEQESNILAVLAVMVKALMQRGLFGPAIELTDQVVFDVSAQALAPFLPLCIELCEAYFNDNQNGQLRQKYLTQALNIAATGYVLSESDSDNGDYFISRIRDIVLIMAGKRAVYNSNAQAQALMSEFLASQRLLLKAIPSKSEAAKTLLVNLSAIVPYFRALPVLASSIEMPILETGAFTDADVPVDLIPPPVSSQVLCSSWYAHIFLTDANATLGSYLLNYMRNFMEVVDLNALVQDGHETLFSSMIRSAHLNPEGANAKAIEEILAHPFKYASSIDINAFLGFSGASPFAISVDLALAGDGRLLDFILVAWDQFKHIPNVNNTICKGFSVKVSQTVLNMACELALKDKPRLLSRIMNNWFNFVQVPDLYSIPLEALLEETACNAITYAFKLAESGKNAFLLFLIAHYFKMQHDSIGVSIPDFKGYTNSSELFDALYPVRSMPSSSEAFCDNNMAYLRKLFHWLKENDQPIKSVIIEPVITAICKFFMETDRSDYKAALFSYLPQPLFVSHSKVFLKLVDDLIQSKPKEALNMACVGYFKSKDLKDAELVSKFKKRVNQVYKKIVLQYYSGLPDRYQERFDSLFDEALPRACHLEDNINARAAILRGGLMSELCSFRPLVAKAALVIASCGVASIEPEKITQCSNV